MKLEKEICYFCGNTHFAEQEIEQMYHIRQKHYVVQNIPARVCTHCGEPVFAIEVGEQIRKTLNEEIVAPHKTVALEQNEFV